MDFITIDKYKATLLNMIGVLAYKIETLAFHEVVDFILVVEMLGGHGVFVITDDTVDGDAV